MNSGSYPETFRAPLRGHDAPFDHTFEKVFFAVEDQRNDRSELRPAVGRSFEVFQQQAVVGREIVSVGGVTGRMHARSAAQRLHFESGIVGEAVESRAVVEVMRLLRSVAFEGLLLFGNLLRDAAFAGRHQPEAGTQHGLHLHEFMRVIRSEEDIHCVCFGL